MASQDSNSSTVRHRPTQGPDSTADGAHISNSIGSVSDGGMTYDATTLAPSQYSAANVQTTTNNAQNWCTSTGSKGPPLPPANAGATNGSASNSKCSFLRLMHRRELPKHLQFNPYIDTGYRPLLSAWECILSLFYLHNETVNIITHGIPMLYIFFMWRSMVPWDEIKIPILPWTHLLSCVSPWVGSTIYHMFMNHRAGESCYRSLLHLDMFGIWITQSFGALTTVYASVSCLTNASVWRVLAGYCVVSLWCLYKALTATSALKRRMSFALAAVAQLAVLSVRLSWLGGGDSIASLHYMMQASHARNPWERRFCFTLPFLMRAASVVVRLSESGGGNPDGIRHIFLQDFLAVLGGFVGALRIPEKWIPGRLDMLANSHHIMHVVVVWAVYHLHQGAILDLVWLSKNPQCPGLMDPQSLL